MKHTLAMSMLLAIPLLCSAAPDKEVAAGPDAGREALKAFVGAWDCKGTVYAWESGASQPGHHLWTFTADLGGWVRMTGQQLATDEKAKLDWMTGMQYMGYDSLSQEYLVFGIDDRGGTWSQIGQYQGDGKIIYHGPYRSTVNGELVASRDTWQVTGGKLYHTGEIERNGKYRKSDDEVCTRK